MTESYCGNCHDWTSLRSDLPCPACPGCGEPPGLAIPGDVQAFCGNEKCRVFTWNPSITAFENFNDMKRIDLGPGPFL